MSQSSDNNKRIAKNTLLLYVRMLFMMLVGLYTSRVILQTLGVIDFGIFNVVGGVIAMMGFIQGSLGAASSRFITYNLGKGDMSLMKKTFSNIITIHIIFAGLILLVGETVGLWFVINKLQIPENRHVAAIWVYQFSILTSMMSIISVPYNSAIIAHEKMSAFAYISIADAILKLLIVYILVVIPYDKLITYSILFFSIQLFDRIVYWYYCSHHFEETKVRLSIDKKQFKEIFSFAGWTMNGTLAVIGYTQGLNILLNLFFGPAVNAARGIAVQVQNITRQFCTNFQMALNPQLTKSYAKGDLTYMHKLLITSSKFSFFIMFIIALPLMLEANLVLHWWLGIVPQHTVSFLRLILCTSLLFSLSNPIIVSVHATGNIKKFQIIEGTMLLLIVPIAYVLLKFFHIPPESVFIVHIFVEICTQFARLKVVLPMINMSLRPYFHEVIVRLLLVVTTSSILPILIYDTMDAGIVSFLIVCFSCVICLCVSIYFFGCNASERAMVSNKVKDIYIKLHDKI